MVEIRPITEHDIITLAPELKEFDLLELRATTNIPVNTALTETIEASDEAFSFTYNGEIVGMFGCQKRSTGAVVWMVSNDRIAEFPKTATKQAIAIIDAWAAQHHLLWNYVYSGNERSIAWLKRLGFAIHATVPSYGSHNEPYHCMIKEG
ncbi:DUF2833 domain-containing protein [Aeromonas caviae]|uniref:phage protein Gp13 family protein n=1 Tax=Aeromonas caviae TaxID=648 RepID=UPI000537BC92|nr:phage protein Gp13 family protein [Aeromonas caviae]AUU21467.1 DUF2833 domain-containing protein [Aeromonas caviae]QOK20674.1 DUF2833 domain-containing protein [Aeromonas caviae]